MNFIKQFFNRYDCFFLYDQFSQPQTGLEWIKPHKPVTKQFSGYKKLYLSFLVLPVYAIAGEFNNHSPNLNFDKVDLII